jgi:tetratricopeptide (TPR) repeat protein
MICEGPRRFCLERILAVLVLFVGCLGTAETAGVSAAAIQSAISARDFSEALELLHSALQSAPNDPRLLTLQGVAYRGLGDKKASLLSFQKALKISPNAIPALHGAAQIEYESGSASGIPLLQHLLQLEPGNPTTHGMLAVLAYQRGNCNLATVHFKKVGTLFDSEPAALHAFTVCLLKLKQYDEAVRVFQRTVNLSVDEQGERHVLAAIQLMAKRPADALTTLEPLLQTGSPDAETLELASSAYEYTKDTARAVSMLREAILLDPQNVNLYLDFANISYAHGSFQVGIDVINDGLGLQPNAAPLYFARGVLYVQLANFEKAETDFEKAYELDPSQSLSSAAQGLAAAQQNDFERALAKTEESLSRKPDDPLMLYLQADILAQKHPDPDSADFQLAMRSARKAVSLQPTLAAAQGVLAKLYLQSGRYKEAAEECRKALLNDPKDQASVYHLIQALRKIGNNDEVPDLLKRLALLRRQAAKETSDRYQYRLVEGAAEQ